MTPPDLLFLFVQVAVTLAGFTGVIVFIDRGAAHVSKELVSLRVRRLAIAAVSVVVLASVPFMAIFFGLPETQVWHWGCLVEVMYTTYFLVALEGQITTLSGRRALGVSYGQYYIYTAIGAVTVVALMAGFVGALPAIASYVAGVFLFTLGVAIFFLRLIFMLDDTWRGKHGAG